MYYKSWKKLTDKVYILGGLDPKASPRDLIKDFLMEAENELVKRTGIIEDIVIPNSDSNEVLLPSIVNKIESVYYNGKKLIRHKSSEMLHGSSFNGVIPSNSSSDPTSWTMKGDRILYTDGNHSKGQLVVKSSRVEPSQDLLLKGYHYIINNAGTMQATNVTIEKHADKEFADFWNNKVVYYTYVPDENDTAYYVDANTYAPSFTKYRFTLEAIVPWADWGPSTIHYGLTTGACTGYDSDETGDPDDTQPTDEAVCIVSPTPGNRGRWTWTDGPITAYFIGGANNTSLPMDGDTQYYFGNRDLSAMPNTGDTIDAYQRSGLDQFKIHSSEPVQTVRMGNFARIPGDIGRTNAMGKLGPVTYPNYREVYGPTINKKHQDCLPWFVLGQILQPINQQLAEQYQQKFFNYIEDIQNDFLDNDLSYKMGTEIRSNIEEGGY